MHITVPNKMKQNKYFCYLIHQFSLELMKEMSRILSGKGLETDTTTVGERKSCWRHRRRADPLTRSQSMLILAHGFRSFNSQLVSPVALSTGVITDHQLN